MNRNRRTNLLFCLLLLAGAASAHAQWNDNGNIICGAPGNHYEIEITADEFGGAILVWRDGRADDGDVYAQRIDGGGASLWSADGAAICTAAGIRTAPRFLDDGTGGAFLGWSDNRFDNPTSDVYIEKAGADGSTLWIYDGRWVNTGASLYSIVDGGASGAYLVWSEAVTYPTSVAVKKITAGGSAVWPEYVMAGQGYNMSAVPDGSGGLVIGWQRWWSPTYRNTVRGQHLDANGTLLWPGDMVSPTYGYDLEPDIASDGAGRPCPWSRSRAGPPRFDKRVRESLA